MPPSTENRTLVVQRLKVNMFSIDVVCISNTLLHGGSASQRGRMKGLSYHEVMQRKEPGFLKPSLRPSGIRMIF